VEVRTNRPDVVDAAAEGQPAGFFATAKLIAVVFFKSIFPSWRIEELLR
jgi:hypothetical protein